MLKGPHSSKKQSAELCPALSYVGREGFVVLVQEVEQVIYQLEGWW